MERGRKNEWGARWGGGEGGGGRKENLAINF